MSGISEHQYRNGIINIYIATPIYSYWNTNYVDILGFRTNNPFTSILPYLVKIPFIWFTKDPRGLCYRQQLVIQFEAARVGKKNSLIYQITRWLCVACVTNISTIDPVNTKTCRTAGLDRQFSRMSDMASFYAGHSDPQAKSWIF